MRKFTLGFFFIVLCLQLMAQTRTITGKVVDESGTPLTGVSVVLKGSNTGTVTSADGSYSLNVPQNGRTLVFSSINMGTREISIGDNTFVNATLSISENSLQEVVVTGVGTATSKKKIAFAVESVTAKDLPQVPQGITQALVGKIAGAQITSSSGQPGQQANIVLRGINSISSTQPMILVDGIQILSNGLQNGSATNISSRLADLDLNNVERVEVIQGAAAATIYGAQGANGVIQIFTKKGKRDGGRVRVNFSSTTGVDNVLRGNLELAKNHFYETDAEGYILNTSNTRLSRNTGTGIWQAPKVTSQYAQCTEQQTL